MASSVLLAFARFAGIIAPTLFCGFTAGYSFLLIDPLASTSPNEKTTAKQWFRAYSLGPYWVPPMLIPGTLSNLFLAYKSSPPNNSLQKACYLLAALGIFSIAPITFLYMEPGINGACKWRMQIVLKEERVSLQETNLWMPSAVRHGSTKRAREWAEKSDMKSLILYWRWANDFRWIIGGFAAICSGFATFSQGE